MPSVDFEAISQSALRSEYIHSLLPAGKLRGRELLAGDIHGSAGDSFAFNTETGLWSDFATGEAGGDVVSLVAAREGISQGAAARRVAEDLGLKDASPKSERKKQPECPAHPDHLIKQYDYCSEHGEYLYSVRRYEAPGYKKAIRQGRDMGGTWAPSLDGVSHTLYGLPEVVAAKSVLIVEGENKVDALKALGLVATCNSGGAGKWKPEHAELLRGKTVFILPDHDEPGKRHAEKVLASLSGIAEYSRIVDLPGLRTGEDIIDWLVRGGDKDQLFKLLESTEPHKKSPLDIDLSAYSGLRYLDESPPSYKWLLKDSLVRGCVGVIGGPPGAGKGVFALQMATSLAAGMPVLGIWEAEEPCKVLFVSAEDDETTLHRRVHHSLQTIEDESSRRRAAENIRAVPVTGDCSLFKNDVRLTGIVKTDTFDDLHQLIEQFKPDLIVLDTLARFCGVEENDNQAVTAALGKVDALARQYNTTILLIHHTNKQTGSLANRVDGLGAALEQTAFRGASAIVGSARWCLLLAPISQSLAPKFFGDEAKDEPDGSFLAVRVVKKNAGLPEYRHYFSRGPHGLLQRVETSLTTGGQDANDLDTERIIAEIERRATAGKESLSRTAARELIGSGARRTQRLLDSAIADGKIVCVPKEKGRGEVLSVPAIVHSPLLSKLNEL